MLTVKVSDLVNLINQLLEDNIDIVQLDILEADDDGPACLTAEGICDDYMAIDYDHIDAID
jgi:hypothetical protein